MPMIPVWLSWLVNCLYEIYPSSPCKYKHPLSILLQCCLMASVMVSIYVLLLQTMLWNIVVQVGHFAASIFRRRDCNILRHRQNIAYKWRSESRLANSGFGHSGTPSPPFPSLPPLPSFSPPLPPSRSPWVPPLNQLEKAIISLAAGLSAKSIISPAMFTYENPYLA